MTWFQRETIPCPVRKRGVGVRYKLGPNRHQYWLEFRDHTIRLSRVSVTESLSLSTEKRIVKDGMAEIVRTPYRKVERYYYHWTRFWKYRKAKNPPKPSYADSNESRFRNNHADD